MHPHPALRATFSQREKDTSLISANLDTTACGFRASRSTGTFRPRTYVQFSVSAGPTRIRLRIS